MTNKTNNKIMIPTEDIFLDKILGGGIPKNCITLIGPAGTGKSSMAVRFTNVLNSHGYKVIYYDVEQQLIGRISQLEHPDLVEIKKIFIFEEFLSDIVNILEKTFSQQKSNKKEERELQAFVIDSITSFATDAEYEALKKRFNLADMGIAFLPRLISMFLRNVVSRIIQFEFPIIIVSQYRRKIQMDKFSRYPKSLMGEAGDIPGGEAFKHYSSVIIETLPSNHEKDGFWVKMRCLKSKISIPIEIKYFLHYHKGFDKKIQYIRYAIKDKIIPSSGGWYEWKGKKYRQTDLEKVITDEDLKQIEKKFDLEKITGYFVPFTDSED